MTVSYHPAVEQEVAQAVQRYDSISERLGNEFSAELRRVITLAAANPGRYHLIKPGYHRANLNRFPHHLVYRPVEDGIRVVLVRHHRRHPAHGMKRS